MQARRSRARVVAPSTAAASSGPGTAGQDTTTASVGPAAAPAPPPTHIADTAVSFARHIARHPTFGDAPKALKESVFEVRKALFLAPHGDAAAAFDNSAPIANSSALQAAGGSKKRKSEALTHRLCSPSLFVEEPSQPRPYLFVRPQGKPKAMLTQSAAEMLDQLSKQRTVIPTPTQTQQLDKYLNLVGDIFYSDTEALGSEADRFGLIRRTTLGVLTSKLRNPSVLDTWSPHEVALFEAAICIYGKMFSNIQKIIPSKTVQQIVEFYYVWKKSKNYSVWKQSFTAMHQLSGV